MGGLRGTTFGEGAAVFLSFGGRGGVHDWRRGGLWRLAVGGGVVVTFVYNLGLIKAEYLRF